ncbi:TetR/AcrR family transcriptional regulator [filamentous cyanobacterium LEGE 11480]|uniref:TetR/AcrR family transcriptional regulator n=1 Tax=Romeriopsis navalis LEGE 11480 TaxID=2777977 RepID=A0A928VPC5_9CYAN|nr:TetR/AcrR family transcriptional regulator [Romeriopsis navalis]MBE9030082.1 TetR/AcrR family transcriptional regulator [Romeriopsis navalis LEGE 11480]
MSKAEITKRNIIEKAANLFNQQGFAGASMADLMAATGLKKGGIYNHFSSKEALAIAAFDYAVSLYQQRYRHVLREQRHSVDRIKAIVTTFCGTIHNPPLQGGCPLINTAIDSDDTNPVLRDRTRQAMDQWRLMITKVVDRGTKSGELSESVDSDELASILISTMEGAIMLTKLYDDPLHIERVEKHLLAYVEQLRQHQPHQT